MAIACLITLPQRCKLKEALSSNPALKNLGLKRWGRLIARLLFCFALINPSSLIVRKRRISIGRRNKIRRTLIQLPRIMPLRVIKKKATGNAISAWKKLILLEIAQNLQKTCVDLSNFHAGDWWWWKDCYQNILHLLLNSILGRVGINKRLAQ